MCLPEGMDELFEMVRFERTDQSYDIWLDEKKKLSDEDYRNPNIVARGYTDYVTVQDYPMRGRPVYLHMRKNKWWDKKTNEIFSYKKLMVLGNNNFRAVIKTFKNHAPTILNYFRRRATNASAKAFNSKVKIFRSQMRGVRNRDFFIFQLVKLHA